MALSTTLNMKADNKMARSEDTIRVDGKTVHYWEASPQFGETILLLHGGFGDADTNWSACIDELAETYHVIAPDLPGYGGSESINITIQSLVTWTEGFLTAMEIEQAVIVGHSFGGLIARILAAQSPKLTPVIVLVNGGVIPAVPTLAKFIARLPVVGGLLYRQIAKSTTNLGNLQSTIITEDVLTQEFREAVRKDSSALAQLMRSLSVSPLPEERTPPLPTLLLWGEEDPITPRVTGERIKDNIPGAKLSLIANVGHMPQLEVPDIFVWQIKNFLLQLARARQNP